MLKTGINRTKRLIVIFIFYGLSTYCTAEETKDSYASFAARVRSEIVNFEDIDRKKAHGSSLTVLLRADLQKRLNSRSKLFLQLDHVQAFRNSRHSDGVLDIGKPTIADPQSTEINQLYFQADLDRTKFTLGRQELAFGDHRFIGDVGFRQNEQTYDGIRIERKFVNGLEVNFAHLVQVNRIFGNNAGKKLDKRDVRFSDTNKFRPKGLLGNHDINGNLLHFEYDGWDYVETSAFAYLIDNKDNPAFSNRTVGASIDYQYKKNKVKWIGSFIFASQQRQESAISSWLSFARIEAGIELKPFKLSYRKERFGEEDDVAFVTPLATLHKFQGWTDLFLTTPKQGLVDSSFRLSWKKRPFEVDLRLHYFRTLASSLDLGREIDIDFIYKPNREHEIKLRLAGFESNKGYIMGLKSVKKLFLMYSYKI